MKSFSIILTMALSLPAHAQPANNPVPKAATEIVMDVLGKTVSPWTKGKSCPRKDAGKENCQWVVLNAQTREIARVGDRWASKFAPTGNGHEVRRLEPSIDKATRLAASSSE